MVVFHTEERLHTRNVCVIRQCLCCKTILTLLDNYYLKYQLNLLLPSATHHLRLLSLFKLISCDISPRILTYTNEDADHSKTGSKLLELTNERTCKTVDESILISLSYPRKLQYFQTFRKVLGLVAHSATSRPHKTSRLA